MAVNWSLAFAAAALLAGAAPESGVAQIGGLLKRAEESAKKKADDAAKKKAEDAAKAAVDRARTAAEGAGKKASGDSAAVRSPADSAGRASPAAAAAGSSPAGAQRVGGPAQDAKVWENYDFVPGSRVLFYTDFAEDKVGNFASRLKYRSGPVEVVERDGARVLRATGKSEFLIPVGRKLPDRFTLEIDVIAPAEACCLYGVLFFEGGSEMDRGDGSADVSWAPHGTAIMGGGQHLSSSTARIPEAQQPALRGSVAHVRVLMDRAYFKMYSNERRMYNVPELAFKRDSVIRVLLEGSEEPGMAVYVTAIRVAESETDVLYDALAARGRWATQGILFATGKSELQPESRPVLKEIATTLSAHPELKVLIEGHTDNVGATAANLALSAARAAAVKAALVGEFGIAGDRISASGLGDTKPASPNTTPEGRAQNRRVEVVKQ